jgi:hypothetical protein
MVMRLLVHTGIQAAGQTIVEYPRNCRSHASKVLPFPGEIAAEYFILLKKFLIFIAHYAADDHLICDLLPADHFLQQAFGQQPDISLLY